MKRTVYLSGFIASFLVSTGVMFKIMHWPYAGMILFSGFTILNFVFLPTFFYYKYKNSSKILN